MSILDVRGLCKSYPAFKLSDVSFSLEQGKISGFIGRNGAGKTTTLKSLLGLVRPDVGSIRFWGKDFSADEFAAKERIGFVLGGVNYYMDKKLKTITGVTKSFYPSWDDAAYSDYLRMFSLDESKTPAQLSTGMRIKYSLALALSHNAELLILDEPTSGLDPVSRDDLLDCFMELCERGITILFSTHITSDLDKCADRIIYIRNGRILAEADMRAFTESYRVLELDPAERAPSLEPLLIGCKRTKNGFSALIKTEDVEKTALRSTAADLESIMVHMEREGE